MVISWIRCVASSILTIVALSVAPVLAVVCEFVCPTGLELEVGRSDHHAHASRSSTPPSAHHGMISHGAVEASFQASLQAVENHGCCNKHSVAPPFASRSRSEQGPVLTYGFAVLVEAASAAPLSRAEKPGHRPLISPPTPARAPLVLRI